MGPVLLVRPAGERLGRHCPPRTVERSFNRVGLRPPRFDLRGLASPVRFNCVAQ
jgi:hypothetical protein